MWNAKVEQYGSTVKSSPAPWARTRIVVNRSLGLETPKSGIVWFLSEPPSCVGTPWSDSVVQQSSSLLPSRSKVENRVAHQCY